MSVTARLFAELGEENFDFKFKLSTEGQREEREEEADRISMKMGSSSCELNSQREVRGDARKK